MDVDSGAESGGTVVRILGEELPYPQPCHVLFGSTEATVVSASSTEIVVVAPAHPLEPDPGSFDVVPVTIVTDGQGAEPVEAGDFYYYQD